MKSRNSRGVITKSRLLFFSVGILGPGILYLIYWGLTRIGPLELESGQPGHA